MPSPTHPPTDTGAIGAERSDPKPLSHDAAIDALVACAATVTVLSYQEAIEGYFKLRGLPVSQ